jgi:hypothetical protein
MEIPAVHHHYIDHIGGLRAFAAVGATIVVGKGDGSFYRKVLSEPETLNPRGTKQVPPRMRAQSISAGFASIPCGGHRQKMYRNASGTAMLAVDN